MKTFSVCSVSFSLSLTHTHTYIHIHSQFPSLHSSGYITVSEDSGCQYLLSIITKFSSIQFRCSVVSDFLRPHEPQHARPSCPSPIPRVTQTHVHWVSDTIQPSHPLSSPSPALNLSQHQDLFKWVSSLQNESTLHWLWGSHIVT